MVAHDTSLTASARPSSDPSAGTEDRHHAPGLRINDVTLIRGERILQRGITHQLQGGGLTLLTGPNGCGKSSLLRAIAGRLPLFSGSIECAAPKIYIGHADGLSPVLDGRRNLMDWAAVNQVPHDKARIEAVLTQFDASHFASMPLATLSRGQRRRLALCRLLLGPADALWLLDEPNVGLDSAAIERLDNAIIAHMAGGGMVMAATHLPLGPQHDGTTTGGKKTASADVQQLCLSASERRA